jgi:hypothetical protein
MERTKKLGFKREKKRHLTVDEMDEWLGVDRTVAAYKDRVGTPEAIANSFKDLKIIFPEMSLVKIAKELGITEFQLKKVLFRYPEIVQKTLDGIRLRHHGRSISVDNALFYMASVKKDPRAIDLWYRRIEGWVPKVEQKDTTIQIIVPANMLPPDKRKEVIDMKVAENVKPPIIKEGEPTWEQA